jgi:hypothetical protein
MSGLNTNGHQRYHKHTVNRMLSNVYGSAIINGNGKEKRTSASGFEPRQSIAKDPPVWR